MTVMKSASMHRYVIGWVVLLGAIAVTFPIAIWRVSQDSRYVGQAVKSESCTSKLSNTPVSWWENCRSLAVKPEAVKP